MTELIEDNKFSVARLKPSFLQGVMDGNLAAAPADEDDRSSNSSTTAGGVRETPTRQELAIEGECLVRQGEYNEAVPLLEKAIMMERGSDGLQSALWNLLGKALFAVNNFENAAKCHAHDLAVSLQIADEESQARAYWNLGAVYREIGDLKKALICYEGYHLLCEKLQGPKMLAKAHKNLGNIYLTLGHIAVVVEGKLDLHAHKHLIKAVSHLQKYTDSLDEKDNTSLARAYENLGYCFELLRNFDKAIDYYQKCLKAAVAIKDRLLEGQTFCYIGNCLKGTVQPEKAIECYKRSLGIAMELGEVLGEATVHSNLAASHEMLCSLDTALDHHNEHYSAAREAGYLQGQALALANIARVQEIQGNVQGACETWQEAVIVYKEMKRDTEVIDALAKITKLRESHPGTGQRRANAKGWKKFKKQVKRRSSINEPVHVSPSPINGSSPVTTPRSNSWGKKVPLSVSSHDKKPPVSSPTKEAKRNSVEKKDKKRDNATFSKEDTSNIPLHQLETEKREDPGTPIDKREGSDTSSSKKEDSIHQLNGVGSSTSSLAAPQSGSLEPDERHATDLSDETCDPISAVQSTPVNEVVLSSDNSAQDKETVSLQEAAEILDTASIYSNDFGTYEHREEMARLSKMLQGDHLDLGPTDQNVIEDWNGWRLAPKENIIAETKESGLI